MTEGFGRVASMVRGAGCGRIAERLPPGKRPARLSLVAALAWPGQDGVQIPRSARGVRRGPAARAWRDRAASAVGDPAAARERDGVGGATDRRGLGGGAPRAGGGGAAGGS